MEARVFELPVRSVIAAISTDEHFSRATVVMRNGDRWESAGFITAEDVAGLLFASSPGRWFHHHMRRTYGFQLVSESRASVSPSQVRPCPDCSWKTRAGCSTCLGVGMMPALDAKAVKQMIRDLGRANHKVEWIAGQAGCSRSYVSKVLCACGLRRRFRRSGVPCAA